MNQLMIADLCFRETIFPEQNNIKGGLVDLALYTDVDALQQAGFIVEQNDIGYSAVRTNVSPGSIDVASVAMSENGSASASASVSSTIV
ncbi:hypothetical protein IQ238_24290 [Pleurocapsales cyanobacterium LEGE 06147]|nr:hypothetical protein [Pleurocapsales cyanobacterium LEGE 06147]